MDDPACTCGFVPTDDYYLTDHLGEVFIPADDRAPDGQLHAEAARDPAPDPAARDAARAASATPAASAPLASAAAASAASAGLACRCGYRAPDGAALDAHMLSAFSPPDAIGPDGRRHIPAS